MIVIIIYSEEVIKNVKFVLLVLLYFGFILFLFFIEILKNSLYF